MEIFCVLWPCRKVAPLSLQGWSGDVLWVFSTLAVQCPWELCSLWPTTFTSGSLWSSINQSHVHSMDILKLYELGVETSRNPGAQLETDGAQALHCLPWCLLAALPALGLTLESKGLCSTWWAPGMLFSSKELLELDTDFSKWVWRFCPVPISLIIATQ